MSCCSSLSGASLASGAAFADDRSMMQPPQAGASFETGRLAVRPDYSRIKQIAAFMILGKAATEPVVHMYMCMCMCMLLEGL